MHAPQSASISFSRRDAVELAARFEEEGFLIFPRLLTARAVRRAQKAAARLLRERHPSVPPSWLLGLHQLNQPRPQPWVGDIATDSAICALVAALLGAPPVLVSTQLFAKPPSGGAAGEVPWHQDAAAGGNTLAVWIALDDMAITGANGGLSVLPRLHTRGRLPSEPCSASTATFDRIVHEALAPHLPSAVRYAFRAGGAGLHGPLTPHSSPPNTSPRARRVLVLRYCAATGASVRGETFWHIDGRVAREGVEPRHQIPNWSTGELIDRRAVLCCSEPSPQEPSSSSSRKHRESKRRRPAPAIEHGTCGL
jgi:hypothetical protein